jgi:FkbM family methyltransferase
MLRRVSKELCPPALVKLANKFRGFNQPNEAAVKSELFRIRRLPPGKPAITEIFGYPFQLIDANSFAGLYETLFRRRLYDFESTAKEPFIIDCGANVGVSVVWWKTRFPGAKVLAFEADPGIFKILDANCARLPGVKLENAAVWDREGNASFLAKSSEGGHMAEFSKAPASAPLRTVRCVRLRDYLSEKCDFLKLDIEGAEIEVIRDCADCLGNVSRIFVEHHSFVGREQHLGSTISILENAGFRVHAHVELPSPTPYSELLQFNEKDLRLALFCFRPEAAPRVKMLD